MILLKTGLVGECRAKLRRKILEIGSEDGKLWVLSDVINRVNGEGRAGINKAINKTEKQAQK